ncbi:hypothetical protein [Burkholderia metallica]|uniref:hypothetical protein n=1 Tax=Burkholderia metallica TaxID=488729 RepID=UPI001CF505EC|nr:hypothetical protein [Burkholderia metallica]MCA8022893.1 hypothetical protein [Burkholderia metallica]
MDAHTLPAHERRAGLPQRLLLLLDTCLPILGAVLIAPPLPKIRMHLYQTPHADIRVPVVLTMPLC